MFCFKIFDENQDALSTPLKWLSDEDKNWYFEEQIDGQTWIEKANFTNQANYTKKFNDTDIWGMVIILEINDNQNDWIRLTEGIACVFDKLNLECKSIITHGYWAKKHCKNLNFFQIFIFITQIFFLIFHSKQTI